MTLVDLNLDPAAPAGWTLDLETTCLNRDLPNRLPLVGGESAFRLSAGGPIGRIVCLTGRPTKTLRPALKRCRLAADLAFVVEPLSLTDAEEGAHALREILKLYDFADSDRDADR